MRKWSRVILLGFAAVCVFSLTADAADFSADTVSKMQGQQEFHGKSYVAKNKI